MMPCLAREHVLTALDRFPAVALIGPRQAGKTTLARQIAADQGNSALYLDLERPLDLAKLGEPELFLAPILPGWSSSTRSSGDRSFSR